MSFCHSHLAKAKEQRAPVGAPTLSCVVGGLPYLTWRADHPGKCRGHPTPLTAP